MSPKEKKIEYSREFIKQFKKAPQEIKISFRNRLLLFLQNPYDAQLNNHKLSGELKLYRSINIGGDWRALYSEYESGEEKVTVFHVLGTHSQIYG